MGTWNTTSINGKEEELTHEFDKAERDTLITTETNKKRRGEMKLELLLYIGIRRKGKHRNRVFNKEED